MYASVYTESASGNIKDQLYMFNPAGFYKFQLDDQSKGMLKLESIISSTSLGLDDLIRIGESLLRDMWGDEDFGLMSGDVLRAFQGDIITLAPVAEDGGLIPVYDPFVLHQIKNAISINPNVDGGPYSYRISLGSDTFQYCAGGCVYQDANGNLVSHWITPVSSNGSEESVDFITLANAFRNAVISIDSPVTDPALIVEVTRLMSLGLPDSDLIAYDSRTGQENDGTRLIRYSTGSDVVAQVRTFTASGASGYFQNTRQSNVLLRTADKTTLLLAAEEAANFEYLPMLFCLTYSFTYPVYTILSSTPLADLKNYTVQNRNVIKRLHELSLLSLLYVPGVAKQLNYMK